MSKKLLEEGFGFIPSESVHHFLVSVPATKTEDVEISEHLSWDESEARVDLNFAIGKEDANLRVELPYPKWEAIADETKAEFNRRLKEMGLKPGKWKAGRTPLSRLLGKELVLLAWAIEDADPALVPIAIKNWLGLVPEERWWLFTMTNAATGHALSGKNKGWRKAVRFALTENPVSDVRPYEQSQFLHFALEDLRWAGSSHGVKKKRANPNQSLLFEEKSAGSN